MCSVSDADAFVEHLGRDGLPFFADEDNGSLDAERGLIGVGPIAVA